MEGITRTCTLQACYKVGAIMQRDSVAGVCLDESFDCGLLFTHGNITSSDCRLIQL